jgi:ankyrin repeat protein
MKCLTGLRSRYYVAIVRVKQAIFATLLLSDTLSKEMYQRDTQLISLKGIQVMLKKIVAGWALILLLALTGVGQNQGEDFLAAARKGDVAAVKGFLDKGVDVNTKSRYGATALSFACDKGHVEVVRLLLERGADPDVRDTFYKATPMSWAAPKGFTEIVKLLLDKGSKEKGQALIIASSGGFVDMLQMILGKGELAPELLTTALSSAERAAADPDTKGEEKGKIIQAIGLLKKAGAKPAPKPDFKVDEATLKTYTGVYKHEIGDLTFTIKDGKFTGQLTGQQAFTLGAINANTFTALEFDGLTIIFNAEGDKIVSLTLKQGGGTYTFKKAEPK